MSWCSCGWTAVFVSKIMLYYHHCECSLVAINDSVVYNEVLNALFFGIVLGLPSMHGQFFARHHGF
jgi:hypothetical protein